MRAAGKPAAVTPLTAAGFVWKGEPFTLFGIWGVVAFTCNVTRPEGGVSYIRTILSDAR